MSWKEILTQGMCQSQMHLEPLPLLSWTLRGVRAVLQSLGHISQSQRKPLRVSEGRAKKEKPKIRRFLPRPPAPPPAFRLHGVEYRRPRAGGDTQTHKSWEENRQMDRRGNYLAFLNSQAEFGF